MTSTDLTAVGDANVATGDEAAAAMAASSRPLTVSCMINTRTSLFAYKTDDYK